MVRAVASYHKIFHLTNLSYYSVSNLMVVYDIIPTFRIVIIIGGELPISPKAASLLSVSKAELFTVSINIEIANCIIDLIQVKK